MNPSPLTARTRLKWRSFNNIVMAFAVCGLLVLILSLIMSRIVPNVLGTLIADAAAILGTYFLYSTWEYRAIRVQCDHCNNIILSNTPWVCGNCHKTNHNANEHSFLNACGHCKDEPKTHQCHHCGELVFLTPDRDKTSFSCTLNSSVAAARAKPSLTRREARDEERLEKEHEIRMAELDERYEEFKQRKQAAKPKTPREQIVENFEHLGGKFIAAEEFAREKRAWVDQQYKNDAYMRDRWHQFIDDWLRRRTE
jgi:hypothetical protein